jgi:hypothetical protein
VRRVQKSFSAQRDELLVRKRQLEARLADLDARHKTCDRKRATRRKVIVGGAVIAHGRLHPGFRVALRSVLQQAVTRDIDKAVIADLLD